MWIPCLILSPSPPPHTRPTLPFSTSLGPEDVNYLNPHVMCLRVCVYNVVICACSCGQWWDALVSINNSHDWWWLALFREPGNETNHWWWALDPSASGNSVWLLIKHFFNPKSWLCFDFSLQCMQNENLIVFFSQCVLEKYNNIIMRLLSNPRLEN